MVLPVMCPIAKTTVWFKSGIHKMSATEVKYDIYKCPGVTQAVVIALSDDIMDRHGENKS
jgi:hypothetical protein